jgi:hypothetical protein
MKKLCAVLILVGACTTERDAITGTQSLEVTLLSPTDPGDVDHRLDDTARSVRFSVRALNAEGELGTDFTDEVRVYAQFLGTLTPELADQPLLRFDVTDGEAAEQTVTLPESVLGATTLWIDNGKGIGSQYEAGPITGTSPTLWYADPYISNIQTPRDEMGLDALAVSPLIDKQVSVSASRHGANGRMVVTSTYAQGYTLSDVLCQDANGTPPCTAEAYDHVLIFSFSAPRDQFGTRLEIGRTIQRFTGGVSEFNELTEIGFPRTYATEDTSINLGRVPAAVPFDPSWFGPLSEPDGNINFERNESGLVTVDNVFVCELDDSYERFQQWKIDPAGGANCGSGRVLSVFTAGSSFTTDPATLVGTTLSNVTGILRPAFKNWILYPRDAADITL